MTPDARPMASHARQDAIPSTYGPKRYGRADAEKGSIMRCDMPTGSLRMCSRPARYIYLRADGSAVKGYCSQHYRAGGHSRMLRPRPWEFARVWDAAARTNVRSES